MTTQEERSSALLESVICGIVQYQFGLDGSVLYKNANQEAIRIFGYTPQEFWAKKDWNFPELIAPEDRERIIEEAGGMKNLGDKQSFEYRVAQKDGGSCWIIGTAELILDTEGELTIQSVFMDVDDRKKSELKRAELERSELSAINQEILSSLSNLFFGVYRLDLTKGVIRGIRLPKGVEAAGLSEKEQKYEVEQISQLYHPEDRGDFCKDFSVGTLRQEKEQGITFVEKEYRRMINGEYQWVSNVIYLNGENLRDGNAIIALRGIAEKRRQEDVIKALGREYFAIYYIDIEQDSMQIMRSDILVAHEIDFKPEYKYSALARQYVDKFVHTKDRKTMTAFFDMENVKDSVTENGLEQQRIFRRRVEDGFQWMEAKFIFSETKNGISPYVTLAMRNVDKNIRYERETKQLLEDALRRAENASAAKSDFLSRMSHDIRTPINAIIGMTTIADIYIDDQERVRDCLAKVTVSSKHLLGLINGVLDMSKIESGRLELDMTEFNLADFVEDSIAMMRPAMEGKEQSLRVEIKNVEHEEVLGDALRLQQVITNLLVNANKYTPEKGSIYFKLEELPCQTQQCGRYQFVVKDNGIGMSEAFIKKIFDPFVRADDSRISAIPGTGLGLAITYNIVRMMEGDIQVTSQWEQGSCFTITIDLPLQEWEGTVEKELLDLPVLVVDDDADTCEGVCRMLTSIGMKSDGAFSGREAVAKTWEAHQEGRDYFAVILDWKMPDMDGMETARTIRTRIGPQIPIIILSAYDWAAVEKEAREAGIDAFVSKPLFKSKLVHLFKEVIVKTEKITAEKNRDIRLDGKRILVVEDNELNLEIAQEFLKLAGALTESAMDGKRAVDMFAESAVGYYDAILMDIQMPVMNGLLAAKAIRASQRADGATVPILAMTAGAFAEDVQLTVNAGMNAHIAKPLEMDEFLLLIKKWLL